MRGIRDELFLYKKRHTKFVIVVRFV